MACSRGTPPGAAHLLETALDEKCVGRERVRRSSVLSGWGGAEQAVDVILGERGSDVFAHFDRLIGFAAAVAAGIAFDLEASVRPEIGFGFDELPGVERPRPNRS